MGKAAPTLSKTVGDGSFGAGLVEEVLSVDTPPCYQMHPGAGKSVISLSSPKQPRGIRSLHFGLPASSVAPGADIVEPVGRVERPEPLGPSPARHLIGVAVVGDLEPRPDVRVNARDAPVPIRQHLPQRFGVRVADRGAVPLIAL